MRKVNPYIQFVIGFFSIMMLWMIGGLFSADFMFDWCCENIDTDELVFSCIIPMITVILIPVVLLAFTIICKRKSLKVMYISALSATAIPVLASIISAIFSNDGNILTWIVGLTIGLILYPFGRIAYELFDGVNSFYFVYLDSWIDNSTIIVLLVVAIIISLILYKSIKPKKEI
ncbi:MAG: hypothetical protein E7529_05415 [Ruminococcaceae bacterium]|nr:hypothetical protein [Oscillospiraceae bacterium]